MLYALSGATALVYEVVWTRLLTLELGHTVAAASAVLAAFMGGLAAGAFAGGRIAPRLAPARALRAYACIELAIGVFALLVPMFIRAFHPVLSVAYAEGAGGAAFQVVRLIAAIAVVGAPAFVMGATYPLIVRATSLETGSAATLYAANTIGAAVGAFSAGFLLVRAFGTTGATLIAALGNAVVAAIAWRMRPAEEPRLTRAASLPDTAHARAAVAGMAMAAAAGCAALAVEVAWTRTLAMIIGPTTYAFSAMVGCFILGLALGSSGGAMLVRRVTRPLSWVAVLFAGAALATAFALGLVGDAVLDVARRSADPAAQLSTLLLSEISWAMVLVGPAAGCFGALFPFVLAAAAAGEARSASRVYAANTVGAIAGSLGAGLVAIPMLGVRGTFFAVIALAAIASIGAAAVMIRRAPVVSILAIALCAIAVVLARTDNWNPRLLSSGAYKYSAYLSRPDVADILPDLLQAGTLRYYREGATGTVSVRDLAGARTLAIDGKVDASNGGDMLTQRLLAHLPLLTHGPATRVAVIGLGSGVTVGSALTHPVTSADVIEISPEVIEAARWFTRENRDALRDTRVRIIRGDARTHFRLARETRYDVIISEPSNPWMAGVAALFTREFFETLKSRLSPGGIVCQWTHTYDISPDDLRSIVATFSATFADVSMWLVGDGDLLLIGATRPGHADAARVRRATPSAAASEDLAASGIASTGDLAALFLGDAALARRWSAGAVLQTDGRMALEFSAPAATVGASKEDNAADLLRSAAVESRPSDVDPAAAGVLLLKSQAPRRAWRYLSAAIRSAPDRRATIAAYVEAAAAAGHLDEAQRELEALAARHPGRVSVRLELAKLLAARGDLQGAGEHAIAAARTAPDNPEVLETVAAVAADGQDLESLGSAVERLRALNPHAPATRYYDGVLHLLQGDPARARDLAEQAVAANPRYAAAWNLVGAALGAANAPDENVRAAFERAVEADPSDAAAHVNLATVHLRMGRANEAAEGFAEALTLDPGNTAARDGLRLARNEHPSHPTF